MRHLLQILQEMGYAVTLWPDNGLQHQPYTSALQADGVEVVYGHAGFARFMQERRGEYVLIILSRPQVAPKYLDLCRAGQPEATVLFDTVDLTHLRIGREASLKCDKALEREAALWRDVELGLASMADATLVVSPVESGVLTALLPGLRTAVVSNIHEPLAVGPSFCGRDGLLFVGGYEHLPNVDAVEWFSQEILPRVTSHLSHRVVLSAVGSNPPPGLSKLAGPNVRIVGYASDLTPYYDSARVFVCPLRYGAGVKGKIGEVIRHGLPVVTSSIGAEGMHLQDGESCLIADGAEEFAQAVARLYRDAELWERLRRGAAAVVQEHFSRAAARAALESVLTLQAMERESVGK